MIPKNYKIIINIKNIEVKETIIGNIKIIISILHISNIFKKQATTLSNAIDWIKNIRENQKMLFKLKYWIIYNGIISKNFAKKRIILKQIMDCVIKEK